MFAAFSDVLKQHPSLPLADEDYVHHLVQVAEDRLLAKVPSIPDRVAAGTLNERLVTAAVVDIVLRVVKNPDPGAVVVDTTDGPFRQSTRRVAGSDRIVILDSDLTDLWPRRSRRVGTIRLGIWSQP